MFLQCGIDISIWNGIPAYARLTCNDASHLGRQPQDKDRHTVATQRMLSIG